MFDNLRPEAAVSLRGELVFVNRDAAEIAASDIERAVDHSFFLYFEGPVIVTE